jgi:hypothetical protein
LWKNIICRHGIFGQLVINKSPKNKDLIMQFVTDYNIKRIVISPYNIKANGIIERGYKPVINALTKMTKGGIGK